MANVHAQPRAQPVAFDEARRSRASARGADDRDEGENDQYGLGAPKVLGEPRDQCDIDGDQGREDYLQPP